jgi:IS30 family transposase
MGRPNVTEDHCEAVQEAGRAFDQVKENSQHKELSERLEMAVYFCRPHSPWKKEPCCIPYK